MATQITVPEGALKAAHWPIGHIALAVDGSPESLPAIALAKELALAVGAEVTVLHFREKELARYGAPAVMETAEELFGLIRSAVKVLTDAGLTVNADIEDSKTLREAKPIAEAAERFDAQLIVVGSRGLSTGHAAISGSVSHDLIHATKLPVLIAR